jgi:endo-1,4-beta-D-glucanase Y
MASYPLGFGGVAVWPMLPAVVIGCTGGPSRAGTAWRGFAGQGSAVAFLDAYVRSDGQVTRPDQGGDTVREGQAYGLLLVEVTGKPAVFGRIWQWTQDHLQLPSGLFAYHADAAGRVLSTEAASDADLLIAWALLRSHGPGAVAWHQAGRRVGAAVLAHEVTTGPGGTPVLAAGPWATGRPASLDPSYCALPVLTDLAQLTGDWRWRRLAYEAVTLTSRLSAGGRICRRTGRS